MSVLTEVTPITFEGTVLKEHLSRLKVCWQIIAYAYKRKHKCLTPFLILAYFS